MFYIEYFEVYYQIKERHICHQIFKLYMTFLDLGGVLDLECDLEGDLFL